MSDQKRPGRPTLTGGSPSVRLTVTVTPAQRMELKRVADAQGRRMSEIMREMIDDRTDDEPRFMRFVPGVNPRG